MKSARSFAVGVALIGIASLTIVSAAQSPRPGRTPAGRSAIAAAAPGLKPVAQRYGLDTVTVFGPRQYVRGSGSCTEFEESFDLTPDSSLRYVLVVDNGAPDGSQRVSKCEVEFNDDEVIDEDEFGTATASVAMPIDPATHNEIKVELRGPAGRYVTARVIALPNHEIRVFGPETFSRAHGHPRTITRTFDLPAGVCAPHELVLVNGDGQCGNRVTSASVKLNGSRVLRPNDFGHRVATIRRQVTLLAHNTVEIRIASSHGSRFTLSFVARACGGPVLTIAAPPESLLTNLAEITVTGTVADQTAAEVRVNGVLATAVPPNGFSALVPLPSEGANLLAIVATNAAGAHTDSTRTVIRDTQPPALIVNTPVEGATTTAVSIVVTGTVTDAHLDSVTVNGVRAAVDGAGVFSHDLALALGANVVIVAAMDAAGNVATVARNVTRMEDSGGGLPPDPATVAPPLDPTIITSFLDATSFLYTGPNPIQTGVAPGTIDARRAAVIRGRVLMRDGAPLPGAVVRVLGHAEFGQTLSRADGGYDLAVNGGGPLTIDCAKAGYLGAQRRIEAPWRDYIYVDDVALVGLDPAVTTVDFSAPVTVARGSVVEDSSGRRQATVMFEQGTVATLVLPDSSRQTVAAPRVRATEYTVGPFGPQAMPAELPPMSGYTYCVEISLDEGIAANARTVEFDKPVALYVENFLGFPAGMDVPVGTYDRATGLWCAEPDGRVIRVMDVTAGVADVDTDGDSLADAPAVLQAIGLDAAERAQLASLYAPGQTLWRAELTHFSPIDCNFPSGPPSDALNPGDVNEPASTDRQKDCNQRRAGSIVDCLNQVLSEQLGIVGTPFTLNYSTDRTPGFQVKRELVIPVTPTGLPSSLRRVSVSISTNGERHIQDFDPPLTGLTLQHIWDGKDAYGRTVQGAQDAFVDIAYVYPMLYRVPASVARSFGLACYGETVSGYPTCEAPGDASRWISRLTATKSTQRVKLGGVNYQPLGLGGWSLDAHHFYDMNEGGTVYRGSGGQSQGGEINLTLETAAGNGTIGHSGDGGPATSGQLGRPTGLAVGPDGSIYFTERFNHRVRRIAPDGTLSTIAGNGSAGFTGDGGPATAAALNAPRGIALGPDGTLYVADTDNHRIRRIAPDGAISTMAGTGVAGFSGDDGTATSAQLHTPYGLCLSRDGVIYVADAGNRRVRRVDPHGYITTFAGTGAAGGAGDEGVPFLAQLRWPAAVAEGPDGSIYIADSQDHRVRRVTPDGVIHRFAGNGIPGGVPDPGPAVDAFLDGPEGLAVGSDGTVYIADATAGYIRAVDPWGVIRTIAGSGNFIIGAPSRARSAAARPLAWRPRLDAQPAGQAQLEEAIGLALDPDGSLYIADAARQYVRVLRPAFPGFSPGSIATVSGDGSEIYTFAASGRHLTTVDSRTRALRHRFTYSPAGHLASIADAHGNTTLIERDGTGRPQAVVGPYGQRTTLELDANGYLATVRDPAGQETRMSYGASGLLSSYTTARGATSTFAYDALGRLLEDADATGASQQVMRVARSDTSRTVTFATGEGRATTYKLVDTRGGSEIRTTVAPSGIQSRTTRGPDDVTVSLAGDGTRTTTTLGPDPRFGMMAPAARIVEVRTPNNVQMNVQEIRDVQYSDAENATRATLISTLTRVNGSDDYFDEWDDYSRTRVSRTPMGRTTTASVDTLGNVTRLEVAGLAAVSYTYDARGRLASSRQGGREWHYGYDAAGRLASVTDPLLRVTEFEYDAADRLVRQVMPDLREVGYAYDSTGNLVSLTPPGRPAHGFAYTPLEQTARYEPPAAGLESAATGYAYDRDRALVAIERPDSVSVTLGYDAAGRLASVMEPRGVRVFGYDGADRLVSLASPDGVTLGYTYDGSLPVSESWSGVVAGSVTLAYDNRFRPVTQTVNGNAMTLGYDGDGLLVQAGEEVLERSGESGLLTGTALGGVRTAQGYSGAGELATFAARYGAGALFETSYGRDSLGRIVTLSETVLGVTRVLGYGYDTAGRLVSASVDGVPAGTWTYDANGNRLTHAGASGADTASATYDAQDRMVRNGDVGYAYGANGELRLKAQGADTTRYAYDALGNLVRVGLPGGDVIEYVVDGQNRRVARKLNGVVTHGWLYQNGLNVVAELDGAGAMVTRYVYGSRGHVADYAEHGGRTYRLVSDHLGSVRLVVDAASGEVAGRCTYGAWGEVELDSLPSWVSVGYAGGLYDPATGLVRFGARDYDASAGRWTSKDPIGFRGRTSGTYTYSLSDPNNYLDPSGRIVPLPLIAAGAGLGALVGGGLYALNAVATDAPFTLGGLLGATAAGAIAGGVGTVAPAIATSLGLNAAIGTGLVNGLAGVAGALVSAGLDPCQKLTAGYALSSGVFGALGGTLAGEIFPTVGMSNFAQVGFPRTWSGVLPASFGGSAGSNALNAIYRGGATSVGVGVVGPMYVQ